MAVGWLTLGSLSLAEDPIRVVVYQGDGVGKSVEGVLEALAEDKDRLVVGRITAEDVHAGGLSEADVLIHPGGSGSRQGKGLGEGGRQAVRTFVETGGGYLGICAGSYLVTNDYAWSLNLIDAKVVDRRHWARGKGVVAIRVSPTGVSFFGDVPDVMDVFYAQGPLLARREWDDPDVPDYQSLAIFETEIAEQGAPSGVMPGTSAIVRSHYGAGRVVCFSPHPELTAGRDSMITTAVHWLARDEPENVPDDRSEDLAPGTSLYRQMGALLAATRQTEYQHSTEIDTEHGIVRCDCSGLMGFLLRQKFPEAYVTLRGEEAPWRSRPLAVTFYESFVAAGRHPERNGPWWRVDDMREASPGDVVAWRKSTIRQGSATGHVCMIASRPEVVGEGLVKVRVIDSTQRSGRNGFGADELIFTLDDAGRPTGYLVGKRQQSLSMAIGRLSSSVVSFVNPDDAEFLGQEVDEAVSLAKSRDVGVRVIRDDDGVHPVSMKIVPDRRNFIVSDGIVISVLRG